MSQIDASLAEERIWPLSRMDGGWVGDTCSTHFTVRPTSLHRTMVVDASDVVEGLECASFFFLRLDDGLVVGLTQAELTHDQDYLPPSEGGVAHVAHTCGRRRR